MKLVSKKSWEHEECTFIVGYFAPTVTPGNLSSVNSMYKVVLCLLMNEDKQVPADRFANEDTLTELL